MLRFLSRRRGRNTNSGTNQSGDTHPNNTASQIKSQRILPNKNQIECRVILLDGTDLSVYLTVSTKRCCCFFSFFFFFLNSLFLFECCKKSIYFQIFSVCVIFFPFCFFVIVVVTMQTKKFARIISKPVSAWKRMDARTIEWRLCLRSFVSFVSFFLS